jgi:dihydropyrimidinase
MFDICLKGGSVCTEGHFKQTHVYIKGEKIALISEAFMDARRVVDCSGLLVMPGIIDPHVHMALDLGFAKSCDDFESGSLAAIRGGVTTMLDFLDPITSEEKLQSAFETRLKLAERSRIDYGFHATLGHFTGDVGQLVIGTKALGMNSVKVFTTYSESDRKVPEAVLKTLLDQSIVTMVHAEADDLVQSTWHDIGTYEDSRPLSAELKALDRLIQLQGAGTLYVVHVSSGSGVQKLSGRERILIESCPHYFALTKDVFKRLDGGLYLMAPPLRSAAESEKLKGLIDQIHTIGTDHCPFTKAEKLGSQDASSIPKGVGGIGTSFLVMYNLFGERIIDKMTRQVAETFGLVHKGQLLPGFDADVFLFDPKGVTTIGLSGTCDYSIYEGSALSGKVVSTLIRGTFALENGIIRDTKGKYIRSGQDESAG